jgi:hypothetical protein
MKKIGRRLIATIATVTVLGCLFADWVSVQTLVATAGTVGDACVDPMQSSCVATFLGAATHGGSRPDVGAWLGPQYSASGLSLDASLPPGSYTLLVYGRSTETATFRQWKTAEITVQ